MDQVPVGLESFAGQLLNQSCPSPLILAQSPNPPPRGSRIGCNYLISSVNYLFGWIVLSHLCATKHYRNSYSNVVHISPVRSQHSPWSPSWKIFRINPWHMLGRSRIMHQVWGPPEYVTPAISDWQKLCYFRGYVLFYFSCRNNTQYYPH